MICSLSKHEEVEKLGFDDALMLDYSYISWRNWCKYIFCKRNELFTPIADCFLNGITSKQLLKIAKEHKLNYENHFKPIFKNM